MENKNLFESLKGIIREEMSDVNGFEEHNQIPSESEFFFKLFGSDTMLCIRIDEDENLNLWTKHIRGLGYKELAVADFAYDYDYLFIVKSGEFSNTDFLKSDVNSLIDTLIDIDYLNEDFSLIKTRREFFVEKGEELASGKEIDKYLGKTISLVNGHKVKEEYRYSKNEIRKIIYRFFKISAKFNSLRIKSNI